VEKSIENFLLPTIMMDGRTSRKKNLGKKLLNFFHNTHIFVEYKMISEYRRPIGKKCLEEYSMPLRTFHYQKFNRFFKRKLSASMKHQEDL
jgi:hypothetical protein